MPPTLSTISDPRSHSEQHRSASADHSCAHAAVDQRNDRDRRRTGGAPASAVRRHRSGGHGDRRGLRRCVVRPTDRQTVQHRTSPDLHHQRLHLVPRSAYLEASRLAVKRQGRDTRRDRPPPRVRLPHQPSRCRQLVDLHRPVDHDQVCRSQRSAPRRSLGTVHRHPARPSRTRRVRRIAHPDPPTSRHDRLWPRHGTPRSSAPHE